MTDHFFGGWKVSDTLGAYTDGGVVAADSPRLGGAAFTQAGARYINAIGGAVPAGAFYIGGAAHDTDGKLYTRATNPGAGSMYLGGIAFTGDGALHTNNVDAIVGFVNGLPVTAAGAVRITP